LGIALVSRLLALAVPTFILIVSSATSIAFTASLILASTSLAPVWLFDIIVIRWTTVAYFSIVIGTFIISSTLLQNRLLLFGFDAVLEMDVLFLSIPLLFYLRVGFLFRRTLRNTSLRL